MLNPLPFGFDFTILSHLRLSLECVAVTGCYFCQGNVQWIATKQNVALRQETYFQKCKTDFDVAAVDDTPTFHRSTGGI